MSIRHHPTEETLAAFAGATLDEGNSLVVATHFQNCGTCREIVAMFEGLGGQFVAELDGMEVSEVTRSRVFDVISRSVQANAGRTRHAAKYARPSPLSLYESGDWRWIGVGVQWKHVSVDSNSGTRVFMLKAAPGTRLPDHRHVGTEWTCVLQGAFSHQLGRFGPGDFDEADESVEHSPFVEREGPCICLVALNGRIELKSWTGRLLQPLVQI